MKRALVAIVVTAAVFAAGCSTTSSSNPVSTAPVAAWTGKVFVSQAPLPQGGKYKVMGTVEATAKVGYSGADSLHPLLADEARKIGANAVFGVDGGRRVTAFSWAAPFAKGTAIRIDEAQLKDVPGSYQ